MQTSTKVKLIGVGVAGATVVGAALADPLLPNDSFSFLPGLGSGLGGFITNLIPGIITLVVVLGIIGGVVAIVMAIAHLISKQMGSHRK